MTTRELYLVRHAQASFGAEDYDHLSELGLDQARALGRALRARLPHADRAIVGGMRRHRQTADACLDAMGATLPVEEDRGWDEYDHEDVIRAFDPRYADRVALVADLLEQEHPERAFQRMFAQAVARWASGEHDADYAETWSAFRARVADALQRIAEDPQAPRCTLVFTSGGPILSACQTLLGARTEVALRMGWDLANASITKVALTERGMRLVTFNEQAHLTTPPDLLTRR